MEHANIIPRLNRAQGQIKAVGRMIDDGRTCEEIITQLRAARSALKAIEHGILEQHIRVCLLDSAATSNGDKREQKIETLMKAICGHGN